MLLAEKGEAGAGAVDSVNGETGAVVLSLGDLDDVEMGRDRTPATFSASTTRRVGFPNPLPPSPAPAW